MNRAVPLIMNTILALAMLSGCSSESNPKDNKMNDNDYIQDGISQPLDAQPFKGELNVRMVGQDSRKMVAPLLVDLDCVDTDPAKEAVALPEDGSAQSFGKTEGNWLEVVIRQLPVYDDMSTYDYREIHQTYWVDDNDLSANSAVVNIDLSVYDKVSLTKTYLEDVIDERIGYYKTPIEIAQIRGLRDDEVDVFNRYQKRIDSLTELKEKVELVSDVDNDKLLSLYQEMCAADKLR